MEFDDIFPFVYYTIFFLLTIGSWLFVRKLNPKQKHIWVPRLSLLSIVVIGSLIILPSLVGGQFLFAMLGLAIIIFIGYVSVAKVRVCESCGHVTQPGNLLFSAKFCPKCSTKLTPSKPFGNPHV
jgi:hypothetical protein